ncbi:MAG: hypothetical protein GX620_01655 [Chloroflexi bacterium]|nr:hypothetical protein [Chloroflexota bacterium]
MNHLPMTRVMPLTSLRRRRLLPTRGEVLVRVGDRVEPNEVVAHAEIYDAFHILPISRRLRVPAPKVTNYMLVKLGEHVQEGQVIAKRRGLSGNTVRAPASGVISAIGRGRVILEARPKPVDLVAHIPGTVVEVVDSFGAVIEAVGAVVEGAWGAGGENRGVLKCLVEGPADVLTGKAVDASCHGTILIGGADLEPDVLERSQALQVRGIVVGGLAPDLIPAVRALPFPVVVVHGIGQIPMPAPHFRLLQSNEGREAAISGVVKTRWGAIHPEIIVPLPGEVRQPDGRVQSEISLKPGARVRLMRAPHAGAVGTVVGMPPYARRLDTGARVRGADVVVDETDATVFVPLANLELLLTI